MKLSLILVVSAIAGSACSALPVPGEPNHPFASLPTTTNPAMAELQAARRNTRQDPPPAKSNNRHLSNAEQTDKHLSDAQKLERARQRERARQAHQAHQANQANQAHQATQRNRHQLTLQTSLDEVHVSALAGPISPTTGDILTAGHFHQHHIERRRSVQASARADPTSPTASDVVLAGNFAQHFKEERPPEYRP